MARETMTKRSADGENAERNKQHVIGYENSSSPLNICKELLMFFFCIGGLNGINLAGTFGKRRVLTQSLSKPSTSGNPDKSSLRENVADTDTVPFSLGSAAALKTKKTHCSPLVTQPLSVERL